jgi:hypothetical protein
VPAVGGRQGLYAPNAHAVEGVHVAVQVGLARKTLLARSLIVSWNHTFVLPITYPSLLTTSQLALTIWDVKGAGKAVPVGGTTMRLFNEKRCVRRSRMGQG